MKLIPKAKAIRIRIVSGGEEHSSIETLRNNYSFVDILPLVKDGRLHKWLLKAGENRAAEKAYSLINQNIEPNSVDMIVLTAYIFNIATKSIEDLIQVWKRKYPGSFLNYIKDGGVSLNTISSAQEAYDMYMTHKQYISDISPNEWRNIFIKILKSSSFSNALNDFKYYKTKYPMDDRAWSEVLTYHAASVTDNELYLIAQAAYEHPFMKEKAVEWYQKSARSYIKAKEWVNKNLKRLNPKEQELFVTFEKSPQNFSNQFFNSSYPQDLVRFLNVLSMIYRTNSKPIHEQITGSGKFAKYLYIIGRLDKVNSGPYYRNLCISNLKRLTQDKYCDYKTLDKIINSIENKEPIFGVRLWELNYQQAILFIAILAKTELENEK